MPVFCSQKDMKNVFLLLIKSWIRSYLSSCSDTWSAESEEGAWYMSDNSKRCLYPFLKIGVVQLKEKTDIQLLSIHSRHNSGTNCHVENTVYIQKYESEVKQVT